MRCEILEGTVFDRLPEIKPGSVDCAVTSPPYWMLRSYLPKGHALKALELGNEKTPAEYVKNMVRVFGLVRECLAERGTLWVNIGDTYAHDGKWGGETGGKHRSELHGKNGVRRECRADATGLDAGSLCLIPQRLAIALQDDGWIVRSVVCWCLSPSTRVYAKTATTEGPATLHDLIRLDPATVKLWTGSQWTRVRGWSKTRCGNPIRLRLRSGEFIGTTPNHEWPLADGRLVKAEKLKIGDVLATCILPESHDTTGPGIDDDLAWFAGLYLAEGSVWEDAIHIAGHAKETGRQARVEAIALKYGGSSTILEEGGESIRQTVHGNILIGAIRHFVSGNGAHGKHLHPRCWTLSNRLLRAFLDGYLAGDGHDDPENPRWRLGFCRNEALAADLRTLASRLGATLTLNACYTKDGRQRIFEAYRGEIRFERSGHWAEKDRAEIVEITNGHPGEYIDVGVENDCHLFSLASGVLTHNSKPAPMPASVAGWRWMRCRVKTKAGWGVDRPHPSHSGNGSGEMCASPGREMTTPRAEWSDCPGCKKCDPHGGYVLRRGSWRPTSAWEPILMLAKSANYFCDGEAVKKPVAAATMSRDQYTRVLDDADEQFAVRHDHETICDGANLRDVWTIAAEPLREEHYAAYPTELVSRCLKAGTSAKGYCPKCGAPWVRVVECTTRGAEKRNTRESVDVRGGNQANGEMPTWTETHTTGWRPSCKHADLAPRPGVVLDPFSGSGRTGVTAKRLGLDYIGIELNPEYAEMSRRLIAESRDERGVESATLPKEGTLFDNFLDLLEE